MNFTDKIQGPLILVLRWQVAEKPRKIKHRPHIGLGRHFYWVAGFHYFFWSPDVLATRVGLNFGRHDWDVWATHRFGDGFYHAHFLHTLWSKKLKLFIFEQESQKWSDFNRASSMLARYMLMTLCCARGKRSVPVSSIHCAGGLECSWRSRDMKYPMSTATALKCRPLL